MPTLRQNAFAVLTLLLLTGSGLAQKPGPEFWRRVTCEPFEPRTKLEAFENRHSSVVFKGFTRITTIEVHDLRVDAIEMRDNQDTDRARGIVLVLHDSGERPRDSRALVDYEEINGLLTGLDSVARVNETMTKLAGFEARYRTMGDLEVAVFRQTRSGTAVTLSSGICDPVTIPLSLDDLAKVRAMIVEAKSKLDEIK